MTAECDRSSQEVSEGRERGRGTLGAMDVLQRISSKGNMRLLLLD